jgi:uncharacterized membrane protein
MIIHHPLSIAELKARLYSIRKPHQEHTQGLKPSEKLALLITKKIGTIGFFFIIFAWSFLWIGWNTIVPVPLRFDPYPAFVLWLFLSNLIQIMLMPLIMVGQNVQSKFDGIQSQTDYEVNVKAEQEIITILEHLENQQVALDEIKGLLKSKLAT